jgi:vanillate/3-O-methylgallate O-demethylase
MRPSRHKWGMSNDAPPAFPHIRGTPHDPSVTTYTRFAGQDFEPYEHTGWVDESLSWKQTCYIGNWSTLRKALIKGPDALAFLSWLGVNSFAKFDVGQAKHLVMCTPAGKVAAEGVLMRLAEEEFLLTSGPSVLWAAFMLAKVNYRVTSTEMTAEQFILQLQGPNSLLVLEKATGESLRDIDFMRFRKTRVGGIKFQALRQGMSGEIGYELHGPSEQGVALYNALLQAGQEYGIRRLGGRTKMVNHVEACFPTPSVDFIPAYVGEAADGASSTAPAYRPVTAGSFEYTDVSALFRSPVELGWAKNIKFDHDFVGREALEAEVANPRRTMVTLVWNSEDVTDVYASLFREGEPFDPMELPRNLLGCMYADAVMKDGQLVGVTTSRCYSYHFRKMISLCTIDYPLREPGTEVSVIWGRPGKAQKRIRAIVAAAPYKPDNRRVDLSLALSPGSQRR